MAIAFAAGALSLVPLFAEAVAQERGNAQAEQSRTLRGRAPRTPTLPPTGRYVADTGEGFVLDSAGTRPLLRFDRGQETWVLRATPAPRGDVIYRTDAGQQVLRVTPDGGITLYTPRSPGGTPAAYSGSGPSLEPPVLGPLRLWTLMAQRSDVISRTLGHLVAIHLTGDRSETLCVEALIVTTDAILRIARSPTARRHLDDLRSITIIEGRRSLVTYASGRLVVTVNPDEGLAGRPSSERIIRAIIPQT